MNDIQAEGMTDAICDLLEEEGLGIEEWPEIEMRVRSELAARKETLG